MQNFSSSSGSDYFFRGWQLAMLPSIRRFVLVPLLVNSVLFGLSFWWLFHQVGRWIPQLLSHVPHYFQWLSYLLWPIAILTILIVFGYLFSTIANMLASPFNGLLAEQLEKVLRQQATPDNSTLLSLLTDIPRILHREWQKFVYYLPKALLLLMLYFIPGLGQTVAPILWFIFGSWVLAIQYCDYPFDNHKIPFKQMRQQLWQDKADNLQFGALVSVATLIPLINLVIMPVAVCGATAMWVEKYANNQLN